MLNLQQISKTEARLLPTLFKSIEDNRVFKKVKFTLINSFSLVINFLSTILERIQRFFHQKYQQSAELKRVEAQRFVDSEHLL